MASERDYPFDPAADISKLNGLDRLRAVEDRSTAGTLYRLYFQLLPDTSQAEEWDAGSYGEPEPEVGELYDPAGARAEQSDRDNAAVHFAWKEFHRRVEDFEQQRGRRLSQRERAQHTYRFGGHLERAYGRSVTLGTWEARRREWEERITTRGNSGFRGADQ